MILAFGLFTPFKLISISAGIAAVPFPAFHGLHHGHTLDPLLRRRRAALLFRRAGTHLPREVAEYVFIAVLVLIAAVFVALKFYLGRFA